MTVDTEEAARYVVRVEEPEGGLRGTGFFVAPGTVLTCCHVVDALERVRIVAAPEVHEKPIPAYVTARSDGPPATGKLWPFPDLAVIKFDERLDHPCALLRARPRTAESSLWAWGFSKRETGVVPVGSPETFVYKGVEGDGYLKLGEGQSAHGLSGSPLFCPSARAVVAVTAGTRDAKTNLGGYATPVTALLDVPIGLTRSLQAAGLEIRAKNRPAVVAQRTIWNRVFPIELSERALNHPWVEFRREANSSPSDMLRAEYGVVPYMFRDEQLDEAALWCEAPGAIAIAQVAASGGAGKSRFAIELCRRMDGAGWLADIWRPGGCLETVPLPRLLVVDYAEGVDPSLLEATLDAMRSTATDISPARLLLLTRTSVGVGTSPLASLRQDAPALLKSVLDAGEDEAFAVAGLDLDQRRKLLGHAVREFRKAWYGEKREADGGFGSGSEPDLRSDSYSLPLDVLFEALDYALRDELSGQSGDNRPVDRVLRHERRYWESSARPFDGLDEEIQRQAVTLATLGTARSMVEADELLRIASRLGDGGNAALRARAITWLEGQYGGPDVLNPLRPDRLGEAHVVSTLSGEADGGQAMITSVLRLPAVGQVSRCLEVLVRICAGYESTAIVVARALTDVHVELITRVGRNGEARSAEQRELVGWMVALFSGPLAKKMDELVTEVAGTDLVPIKNLAGSYARLAEAARERGENIEASRLFDFGIALHEDILERDPDNVPSLRELGVLNDRLGRLWLDRENPREAERLSSKALMLIDRVLELEPSSVTFRATRGVMLASLGDAAEALKDPAKARQCYERALQVDEELAELQPDVTLHRAGIAHCHRRLAELAEARDDHGDAERHYKLALEINERLARADPGNAGYQRALGLSYERFGKKAMEQRKFADAEEMLTKSRAIDMRFLAQDPDNVAYQFDLFVSLTKLAELAEVREDPGEAENLFRQAAALGARLAAREPDILSHQRFLAACYRRIAVLAARSGDNAEARRLRHEASVVDALLEQVARTGAVR